MSRRTMTEAGPGEQDLHGRSGLVFRRRQLFHFGAFLTTTANGIHARANGTANTIAVNTNAANTNAVTLTCMWMQP